MDQKKGQILVRKASGIDREIWKPNWEALADHIVNKSLRLARGERVVYLTDPGLFPEFMDAVREAVLRAGGIEQATLMAWSPRLSKLRTARGLNPDHELQQLERHAHLDLMNTADVFLWLPNSFFYRSTTDREPEWITERWRGRSVHFHWFSDLGSPPEDPIHVKLQQIYEHAILDLDYAALKATQEWLVAAIRGRRLRVTTPAGTDISFELPADGWYHRNDGDASREKALLARCARDREEELPCGAVRSIPGHDSAEGVLVLPPGIGCIGALLDVSPHLPLEMVFRQGRLVELKASRNQSGLDTSWAAESGDKDRIGEVLFGTNPLVTDPPGARISTYWGLGEGIFRFNLGDNSEQGGTLRSKHYLAIILTDATVRADGAVIIRNGKLEQA